MQVVAADSVLKRCESRQFLKVSHTRGSRCSNAAHVFSQATFSVKAAVFQREYEQPSDFTCMPSYLLEREQFFIIHLILIFRHTVTVMRHIAILLLLLLLQRL